MRLTKNFSKKEFDSKDGAAMPDEVLYNVQKLANQLQYIRDYLDLPIHINSGYRSPEHNIKIGGSINSQHKLGKAADIVVNGMNPKIIYDLIEDLISKGEILQGGLHAYKTFVHYDIRGKSARW
jgi:uncharacterized protein YcbK (DUF882 family)